MNMATERFEIFISGVTSSPEEWKRALEAPKDDLPELDNDQKEVAKRFRISSEEYARGVLAGLYGETRQRERGQKLGESIEKVLGGLDKSYRLLAVIREGVKFRWMIRIETPGGIRNLSIPLELADDVIDSGLAEMLEELKQRVLAVVGQQAGGQH